MAQSRVTGPFLCENTGTGVALALSHGGGQACAFRNKRCIKPDYCNTLCKPERLCYNPGTSIARSYGSPSHASLK